MMDLRGEVDQALMSMTARLRPVDCARGEVVSFQDFMFGWNTLQVTEPAQSTNQRNRRCVKVFETGRCLVCCRIGSVS